MSSQSREATKAIGVAFLGAAVLGLFVLFIAAMWVFGFGWFSQSTSNYRGETSKRNLVEANGSYRIAAYNHFFDLCAQVQTDETSITNNLTELSTTADQQRQTVLNASITALRNERAELINQYNADAAKSYTAGQFRASALPYQLSLTAKETRCVASPQPSPASS